MANKYLNVWGKDAFTEHKEVVVPDGMANPEKVGGGLLNQSVPDRRLSGAKDQQQRSMSRSGTLMK